MSKETTLYEILDQVQFELGKFKFWVRLLGEAISNIGYVRIWIFKFDFYVLRQLWQIHLKLGHKLESYFTNTNWFWVKFSLNFYAITLSELRCNPYKKKLRSIRAVSS